MASHRVHDLLAQLSLVFRAALRDQASKHDLKLVQLEALIFLARANRYSDTPAALTDYLGTTKGTVSQTLKALERRGLLEKVPDPGDGRRVRCVLTSAGKDVVDACYPSPDLRGIEAEMVDAITELLRRLQWTRGQRTFGVCRTCKHYERRGKGGRCGLTGEELSSMDGGLICREHSVPAG